MKRKAALLCLAALAAFYLWQTSGSSSIGLTVIPHGAIFKDFADYRQTILFEPKPGVRPIIRSAEIEIRFPQENLRIIRFPYVWYLQENAYDDQRLFSIYRTGIEGLGDDILRRMGPIKPGDYQLAFYFNSRRASNVIPIRIDPGFDESARPTLQLMSLQPNPSETFARLVVLAKGPTPRDLEFTNQRVSDSPLTIDGWRRFYSNPYYMGGFDGPITNREVLCLPLPLSYYHPVFDLYIPYRRHTVALVCGKYQAAPLDFSPYDRTSNLEWDMETFEMKDSPKTSPVQLEGIVTDAGGKPLPGCQVTVRTPQGNPRYMECTDQDGRYQFVGVPAGTYQVQGFDSRRAHEFAAVSAVSLSNSQAQHLDIKSKK